MLSIPYLEGKHQFDIPYSQSLSFGLARSAWFTSPHHNGNRDLGDENEYQRPKGVAANSIHDWTMGLRRFVCYAFHCSAIRVTWAKGLAAECQLGLKDRDMRTSTRARMK